MSFNTLGVAVAVVLMLPVGSASAEVRSGSVVDPADSAVHLNVDGTSYRDQDIQRITASYDTAGSIALTVYFLDPVPASSPEILQLFFSSFTAGSCSSYTTPAGYALMTVFTASAYNGAGLSIDGYEGSIGGPKTLSADHRAITVHVSSPVLANRDYSCVGSISLHHLATGPWHCDPICTDVVDVVTDTAGVFGIDAATPADPGPEPEGTVTDTPSDTDEDTAAPTARCVAARSTLRKKQKQLRKLKAQRRSTHKRKRKRKRALAKQIKTTRRGIVKTRTVIEQRC